VHQLDARDRDRRITELLDAKHHGDPLLDAPIQQIVDLLAT
jgi:hypothetical protein